MIGIFDSGSGGLSVLSALRARAPQADIIYFGDIGNAPYGQKTARELANLVGNGIRLLQEKGATEIISACNSVSFSVLAGAAGHDRIIEMTRPTARMMRKFAGERVLLLATPATVESTIYREALWSIVSLDELPVPNLARAVEEGAGVQEIAAVVRSALQSRMGNAYDKILLGCTHYPLVSAIIEREATAIFGHVPLIDPAEAVADEAVQRFNTSGTGALRFAISKDSHEFRNRISPLFLETPSSLEIV